MTHELNSRGEQRLDEAMKPYKDLNTLCEQMRDMMDKLDESVKRHGYKGQYADVRERLDEMRLEVESRMLGERQMDSRREVLVDELLDERENRTRSYDDSPVVL